ncbi:DUF7144 family membrane protein [Nocardia jejuensis]|uniref:DUF7144 family membrane protein n=1 Tax=Nocardia jejuensis TaxID=328049 RepID=UPI00082D874D|nr:hypothetical protein [Nocardia jejuensis]
MASHSTDHSARQVFSAGTSVVAAILLLTAGAVSLFQGISAVRNDDLLVVGMDYLYELDTTTWGWIHVVVGVILMISAGGLVTGTRWGRSAAITIAGISIVANFLWLPHYPWWSMSIIVLDVVVIWAIAMWRPQF